MIDVDVPGEYARRLLNRIGDRDMFEVFEATPAALRASFDGVDDAAMRRPEAAGKWSMIEVAQHLADSDMVVGARVRMMLAEEQPTIAAYDQDLWVRNLRYREAALEDVLAQFNAVRAANLRLARRLGPAELARFGVHSERGGESVGYTLRLQAAHDLVHLDQIARIRKAMA
ncbi:MAG TPA: DinB family protein [Thermoanaerobaculia bacterium]